MVKLINFLKSLLSILNDINKNLIQLNKSVTSIETSIIDNHLNKSTNNEINNFEFKAFSQNGEDGIISEIFKRLNIESGYFVEFGVQDGLETNTSLLLFKKWKGIWIEADKLYFDLILENYKHVIDNNQLIVLNEFIKKNNLEEILNKYNLPVDFELLSIDIDSNDYWVWDSLNTYQPKVIVIEYNAFFPIDVEWVMEYVEDKIWDSSINFGASLSSLVKLGKFKGYTLVACNNTGSNAFFIRNDLVNDNFNILPIDKIYKPINYNLNKRLPVLKKIGKII
jgi:hypothetical protein